jgi:hypothetical protein
VRNEAPNLVEWLEFHRLVGVEHVFVYDNASTDRTWDVLMHYQESGFVTATPWDFQYGDASGISAQALAYTHSLLSFGNQWRWMAFIDIDEFLFPAESDDLRTLLEGYAELPGVAVFWSMFGTSGHLTKPEGLVIQNYTLRTPFPVGTKIKSIVDPRRVDRVRGPHRITEPLFDERRRRLPLSQKYDFQHNLSTQDMYSPTSDIFRLHHYYTKSWEEFTAKARLRNEIKPGGAKRLALRAQLVESGTVEDRSAWRFLDELVVRISKVPNFDV